MGESDIKVIVRWHQVKGRPDTCAYVWGAREGSTKLKNEVEFDVKWDAEFPARELP